MPKFDGDFGRNNKKRKYNLKRNIETYAEGNDDLYSSIPTRPPRQVIEPPKLQQQTQEPKVLPAQISVYEGEVSSDRYLIEGVYREGAHSVIYRAKNTQTGKVVAIKKHQHFIPHDSGDVEEIREAEARFRREAEILSKLRHPGVVEAYGFYFREDDFRNKPFLVTELVDYPSLEELLGRGKTFNEQDAKLVTLSVGTIIDYLHTANGRPIIHRDLKPDNVKEMPQNASWPHKIVDFSESKIGKATMSGSVTGTIGYNAPETYGGRMADQSSDYYALMRIAAHMLIGDNKRFMDTWFGNTSLREMRDSGDLNVSEGFLKTIERATSRDPNHRYKTLKELAKDLGYNISISPRTRQELEAILAHKEVPARIEPEEETKNEGKHIISSSGVDRMEAWRRLARGEIDSFSSEGETWFRDPNNPNLIARLSNYLDQKLYPESQTQGQPKAMVETGRDLPEVREGANKAGILIGDLWYSYKKDTVETAKSVLNASKVERIITVQDGSVLNLGLQPVSPEEARRNMAAYLHHVAETDSFVRDSLEGKVVAEMRVGEKGTSFIKAFFTAPRDVDSIELYRLKKQQYAQKRAEVLRVLGDVRGGASLYKGLGALIGTGSLLVPTMITSLLYVNNSGLGGLVVMGSGIFGAIAGGVSGKSLFKHRLLAKAREYDQIVYQAREATGNLERKFEDVGLDDGERFYVTLNAVGHGAFNLMSPSLIGALGTIYSGSAAPLVIGTFGAMGIAAVERYGHLRNSFSESLRNYFTSRALRKRRLSLGLPSEMPKGYLSSKKSSEPIGTEVEEMGVAHN